MDIETVDHMKLVTEQRFETRRKKILFTIVTIFSLVALIFVISVVHEELEKTKGYTVGGVSVFWNQIQNIKLFLGHSVPGNG